MSKRKYQGNVKGQSSSSSTQLTITSLFLKQSTKQVSVKRKECIVIDLGSDDESTDKIDLVNSKATKISVNNEGCNDSVSKIGSVNGEIVTDSILSGTSASASNVCSKSNYREDQHVESVSSEKETIEATSSKYWSKRETESKKGDKRKHLTDGAGSRFSSRLRLKRHKVETVASGSGENQVLDANLKSELGQVDQNDGVDMKTDLCSSSHGSDTECQSVNSIAASSDCAAVGDYAEQSIQLSISTTAESVSNLNCSQNGDAVAIKTCTESVALATNNLSVQPDGSGNALLNSGCTKEEFHSNGMGCCNVNDNSESATQTLSESSSLQTCPTDNVSVADSESTVGDAEVEDYVPYYYENFMLIVRTVVDLQENKHLFNKEDLAIVDSFYSLSEDAQKLFIRLFQRKHRWILQSRMKYHKIASDLSPLLNELVDQQFLLSKECLTDLNEILHLLPAPELRGLAKSLRINQTQVQKSDLIEAVVKHSQQKSISSFFTKTATDSSAHIRKRAKSLLTDCFKVDTDRRGVFLRVLMLFSLTSTKLDDDSMYGYQHQLFRMLMTNIGEVIYPEYTITRSTPVFRTRQDVLWLETSLHYEVEINMAMEKRHYEAAKALYLKAKQLFSEIQSDKMLIRWDKKLPSFLRCFTASSILTRVMTDGVEVLQKLRDYSAAVDQLRQLMKQKVYLLDYRGRWCDRLALNLDQHLKQPGKALDAIKAALSDPNIRGGHKWSLYQRARRICLSPSNKKLKERLEEFQHDAVQIVTKVTIEGRLFPREIPGRKTVFITQSSDISLGDEEITLCGVEDLVLQHYKSNCGFTDGLHSEGSVYLTLFGLFFWDIIFADGVPDVFYGPYQMEPLDIYTEHFYTSRQALCDSLLQDIQSSTVEELQHSLATSWTEHSGVMCSLVSWNRFDSLEQAQSLLACMKGEFLAAVFEKFCKDLRFWHSGLPDLIVWNTVTQTFKISEVKGPGDRLSTKQELWLDFFYKLGCDVEVCHVVGVGARKLKPTSVS